ncbi:hypothetical protein [Nocardiopsis rhodophaea]|uniref:hypothetical protein n=1 Tax=Nocardiopsis rhodophaea TaxID=280238 RepID=UPI0031DB8D48
MAGRRRVTMASWSADSWRDRSGDRRRPRLGAGRDEVVIGLAAPPPAPPRLATASGASAKAGQHTVTTFVLYGRHSPVAPSGLPGYHADDR